MFNISKKIFKFVIVVLVLVSSIFVAFHFLKNQASASEQETGPLKLVAQEIIYISNADLKLERHERVFTIFEFNEGKDYKDYWASTKVKERISPIGGKISKSGASKEELPLLLELLESSKNNRVDLSKLHFLKKASYVGWEGKKEVRLFSSLKPGKQSEKWSKKQVSPEMLKKLSLEFKKRYPKLSYPWNVADLKVKGSFVSSKGKWLIGLGMDQKKTKLIKNFDGIVGESEFSDHWFAIVNEELLFLGLDLHPLLAANFFNNGQTEWLMAYTGYNREGYILWSPDFNKKMTFLYTFH